MESDLNNFLFFSFKSSGASEVLLDFMNHESYNIPKGNLSIKKLLITCSVRINEFKWSFYSIEKDFSDDFLNFAKKSFYFYFLLLILISFFFNYSFTSSHAFF